MKIKFAWYDLWIGAFWDRNRRILYVCPLPMFLIEIPFTVPDRHPNLGSEFIAEEFTAESGQKK